MCQSHLALVESNLSQQAERLGDAFLVAKLSGYREAFLHECSCSRRIALGKDHTCQMEQHVGDAPPVAYFSEERSEEHTSELQSLAYLVCRLLLEKKKKHDI